MYTFTQKFAAKLNKSSWREGGHKKGKGSPYMLPLITVDL